MQDLSVTRTSPNDVRYGLRREAHGAALGGDIDWKDLNLSCGTLGPQAMDQEL